MFWGNSDYFVAGSTIISEFDLVCDRDNLNSFGEMMFLAGVAIGGLICGIISDKCGRKRTLMASLLIQSILGKFKIILIQTKVMFPVIYSYHKCTYEIFLIS